MYHIIPRLCLVLRFEISISMSLVVGGIFKLFNFILI